MKNLVHKNFKKHDEILLNLPIINLQEITLKSKKKFHLRGHRDDKALAFGKISLYIFFSWPQKSYCRCQIQLARAPNNKNQERR
jgi:hypothetical protein